MNKIDINKFIDTASVNSFHYKLAFLAFLITLINGYAVVTLSIIVPLIADDIGVLSSDIALAHLAVMIGILVGSIIAGTLADKYGRRWTIIGMTCISLLFMGLTTFSTSLIELIGYRFFTGIGAGAIPIALTLVSEYIPMKNRNLFMILVFAGPPFSGVVAGNLGPFLANSYGWQAIFFLGLVLGLPILLWTFLALPESVKYLIVKKEQPEKIERLIKRVAPEYEGNTKFYLEGILGKKKSPIGQLFSEGRMSITFLLWILFFSTQFVMFFLNLWVPTILVNEGWSLSEGGRALANFNLGSFFGGFLIGRAADKYGVGKVLKLIFPLSAILLIILSYCIHNTILYYVIAFFAGGATLGANMGLGPFSASMYPVHIRGTGIGTAIGIGRMGAMLAAMLGGYLISIGIGGTTYYHLAVIAPIVCLCSMLVLMNIKKKQMQINEVKPPIEKGILEVQKAISK